MVLQGFAEQLRHPQRRKITRSGVELRGSMSKVWVPSQAPGEIHRSDEGLEECVAENHTGSDIGCSNPWGQNSQTRHPATQRIQTQFLFHGVHMSNCHTIVAITRSEGDQSHSKTKEETEAESSIC